MIDPDSIKNVEATTATASKIKAINKDAVNRICSGQVVLSLAIAVKELVENSLDAGATVIEVRLKEYGKELIEVQDNGSGVTEDNFSGLTLKYYTSKLKEFSDLLGMSTFGFRGEALSSLCALSDLTITTRHSSVEYGTKIVYDSKGLIKETMPCARQIGTTVSLANLFNTLPVRQKEFHKNIKREFNKMTQLLYAYCLTAEGIKILCTNQTAKSKTTVVATQGGSVRDNISCVFGVKQLQTLLPLKPFYPEDGVINIKKKFYSGLDGEKIEENYSNNEKIDIEDIKSDTELDLSEDSSNDAVEKLDLDETITQHKIISSQDRVVVLRKNQKRPVDFDAIISTCAHGSGHSTNDKQFFYVNSRPCEPQKIMKLVNETFKQYNPHQFPFVYFNLMVEMSSVDVNVTPDKRKIFLAKENYLLDVIKLSLQKIYENIPSTLKMENVKEELLSQKTKNGSEIEKPRVFSSFLNQFSSKLQKDEPVIVSPKPEIKRKCETLDNFVSVKTRKIETEFESPEKVDSEGFVDAVLSEISENNSTVENLLDEPLNSVQIEDVSPNKECKDFQRTDSGVDVSDELKEAVFLGYTKEVHLSQVVSLNEVLPERNNKVTTPKQKSPKKVNNEDENIKPVIYTSLNNKSEEIKAVNRKYRTINVTIDEIKKYVKETNSQKLAKKNIEVVKFRSEINPVFNKKCEEELQKQISKDMFGKMKIIGQFNLGFIITQLEDDLFIIDQHATDEKYNFETLQKNTVLSNQVLVIPQSLDLTGVNERILLDNLEIFRKNGFTFEINAEAPPTKRVKLLTIPISNHHVFGKDDIEELLFMLKDGPQEICRPSRVQSMFASRACRKSVMIGTALSRSIMRKLIDHMGEIEQPWNCPHGRPTIRHLINLGMLEFKS